MLSADKMSELQYAFKLNHTYYFDDFNDDDEFLNAALKLIEDKCFIIVFGTTNDADELYDKLLFFNQYYFPVSEIKGYLKKGAYFAFRSDLFKGYSLRNRLKDLGFLEYSMQESLVLKDNHQRLIEKLFNLLVEETKMPQSEIHSTIIASYLNLLLYHMQRFYQRFMEDKSDEINALQCQFLKELYTFFDQERRCMLAPPTATSLSKKLNCTARFLNDISLKVSGKTAQYHIENFIVTVAKQLLAETDLSVAEIAERMKFEHPQSLTRLFKRKTQITPLDFRISII